MIITINKLNIKFWHTPGVDALLEGQVGEGAVGLAADGVGLHLDVVGEQVVLLALVGYVAPEHHLVDIRLVTKGTSIVKNP